jgi:hypothetical protein
MQERRRAPRIADCFAMRALAQEKPPRVGVVRNWSRTGVLFASMSRFTIGESIALILLEGERAGMGSVSGRVVRAERDASDGAMFPWLVALELEPGARITA